MTGHVLCVLIGLEPHSGTVEDLFESGRPGDEEYLHAHNDDPKPFVWTASIDTILEKVGRCKAVLETAH